MDNSGHARITDFGLTAVTRNLSSIESGSGDHNTTMRWIAPEILNKQGSHSKEADIFSFAMVMIEVCCGRSTAAKLHFTVALYQHRSSLALFRSLISSPPMRWLP